MSRHILDESRIHPAIRKKISDNHRDIVEEVQAAIAAHDIVVVGMKQNVVPKRAKRLLKEKNIPFHYLEYGSYLSLWRRRNALKMWTGWPTFPMIFIKGTFIGGADDLQALIEKGELQGLLAARQLATGGA
jgi:monothiol glutaredoxin